jgi:hypothetical protein
MTKEERISNNANAVRKMVIGTIVAEYGMRQLVDNSKQDLKMRVNSVLNACKKVQEWFLYHPSGTPEQKEIFKKEFLSSEILLISELLETVWGINEDGLEEIIKAIKENINQTA